MTTITINYILTFPWPYQGLNPNRGNIHFHKKAKVKKKYRLDCYHLAMQYPKPIFEDGDIQLVLTFNPPDERGFDLDNHLAAMKSGIDGICDWWKIDDKRFNPITIKRGVVKPHGSIELEVD